MAIQVLGKDQRQVQFLLSAPDRYQTRTFQIFLISSSFNILLQTWMRNKNVIAYLGLWEKLNNENFKGHEFTTFEILAGKNSFYMSPQKWIKETNAIGIISKSGNNGDTYKNYFLN